VTYRVDMSKGGFVEHFHLSKDIPDVVRMEELEGANRLVFVFTGGRLGRIVYTNRYAD
jgi:hypothetical protein